MTDKMKYSVKSDMPIYRIEDLRGVWDRCIALSAEQNFLRKPYIVLNAVFPYRRL